MGDGGCMTHTIMVVGRGDVKKLRVGESRHS
jgi:hypothetical protein